ncbi:MAG: sigma-54-dependent Fis family transcriptional regulator [Phycisphaerales bacterium]|nr:sigma-54-dependent Fis family transcriptional regulator [Phycisphaerales bacterium]MCB9856451.1 sigma-54-dependent Fis family transcriptional regulator [Phycisphaerales bacterium]
MPDLLIIDDEETLLASLSLELRRAGHSVQTSTTAAEAIRRLESFEPHVALIDIRLPDANGVDLIAQIRQKGHDFPIVVMTAYGSVEGAVEAMRRGATDYLQKPVGIDEIELVIERSLRNRQLIDRLDVLERERRQLGAERAIIGESESIRKALHMADRIAAVPPDDQGHLPTVLLLGETGTGKDLLAHRIHDLGPRRDAPFVQINCSALPAQLVEAELFGHERGAFTDARTTRKGLFEAASEGTVFLDEIGDMPLELQAKLLIVLENRKFRRIGDTRERKVQARVIAATNVDLSHRVDDERFRRDLLFRLQTFCVELPPLRERGADVVHIAEHFIDRQARRLHRTPPKLTAAAGELMRRYAWPGNIRELDNVLQRAVLLSDKDEIGPADLYLGGSSNAVETAAPAALADIRFPFRSQPFTLVDIERLAIQQALDACDGNVSEAARLLGISRGALRHRIAKEK